MKTLILVRHGQAVLQSVDLKDTDRGLTEQGIEETKIIGTRLRQKQISIDRMMSSTAKRALMTAQLLAEFLEYPKNKIEENPIIYENSFEKLLGLAQSLDDNFTKVLIVGHHPSLSEFVYQLCQTPHPEFTTGTACAIEIPTLNWTEILQVKGHFLWKESP